MSRSGTTALLVLCILSVASPAAANVSLKNGNFFVGYTDVVFDGGLAPKIERVYNSKSPFMTGMYGVGWGSEYEVFLRAFCDGTVVVYEYGSGAENEFVREDFAPSMVPSCVTEMASAAVATGHIAEIDVPAWRKRMLNNASERHDEWVRIDGKQKLPLPKVPMGTAYISQRYGHQALQRVEGGFELASSERTSRFDDAGHLTELADRNGNWIRFARDARGRMSRLDDNLDRWIEFTYVDAEAPRVASLEDSRGKTAEYRYAKDDLIWSKDTDGNVYTFAWSDDNRHMLERIGYQDGTSMEIRYLPRAQQENVASTIDRDGAVTVYSYTGAVSTWTDGTRVEITSRDGTVLEVDEYDYEERVGPTGAFYTVRLRTSLDGDVTDTEYNEMGLPVRITRGEAATTFEYDAKGRVTRKRAPGVDTWLQYEKASGKVSRVDTRTGEQHDWSAFDYDDKGNLTYGEDSSGRKVWMTYDGQGRITTIRNPRDETLRFEYNTEGKPVRITQDGVGSIDITYTADNEIDKVEASDGGRGTALAVTSMMQELLDVIRPAGVSLSF